MRFLSKLYHFITDIGKKTSDDRVPAYSAQSALFTIISFFPFVMFFLSLVQFLPYSQSEILQAVTSVMPTFIDSFVVSAITELYNISTGAVISIAVIAALWSSARGVMAIVNGLNSVYGIKETRNYFKLRFMSMIYTILFAVILIITLCLLVFGNSLFVALTKRLPFLDDLVILIISVRTLIGIALLACFFLLMFVAIPNRKTKIRYELPGALIVASAWAIYSYLYSYYIDNMANTYIYGSLTAIVLLMLWLYFCMYIMFVGAEINVAYRNFLESHRS